MKKQDTTAKAATIATHLRRDGKRRANRAERRRAHRLVKVTIALPEEGEAD